MEKGIKQDGVIRVPDLPVRQITGSYDAAGIRVAVIVSRFNQELTAQLAESAVSALLEQGADPEDVCVVWVPGAYEIPSVAARLLEQQQVDAVIALGVVIQGATQHAQLINQHIALALGNLSIEYDRPVIYEIISANSLEDAQARSAGGKESRGWYAGMAAIEMVQVFRSIDE
jgi:6,7-dimethyl-8-ribityllumazine synthase